MDLNQFLSKSAAALFPPSKLSSLQSKAVSSLEQPVIIPLGGSANINNPLGLVPVQVLNQQLLVPLDTFPETKESTLLLPNSSFSLSSSSSTSLSQAKAMKSDVVVRTQDKDGTVGMNLSLALDPSLCQNLAQSSVFLPLSLSQSQLNQNVPVQYPADPLITHIKQEVTDTSFNDEFNSNSDHKTLRNRSPNLPSSSSLPKNKGNENSSSSAASCSSGSNDKSCPDNTKKEEPKMDTEGLSKIISSLPPGWKVVGMTNLSGSEGGSQPTPVVDAQNLRSDTRSDCNNSPLHMPSPHHLCRVPDVVSVDLNLPTSSSISPGVLSDSFNCQKIENILLPINLSSNSNAKEQQEQPKPSPSPSSSTGNTSMTVNNFPINIKKEPTVPILPEQLLPKLDLDNTQSEWRVVGLTSSPFLPQSASAEQLPTVPLPLPLAVTPETGGFGEDRQSSSRSPKATILNVPSPKLLQQSAKPSSSQKSPSSVDLRNSSEEMMWTIVGVTVASTISSASLLTGPSTTESSLGKIGSGNLGAVKADCVVTNSQQRPVPSSVSKNAPISSKTQKKGVESIGSSSNDQWQVVGVTGSANRNLGSTTLPLGYPLPSQVPQQLQPLLVTTISSLSPATPSSTISSTCSSNKPETTTSSLSSLSSMEHLLQSSLVGSLASANPLLNPALLPLPLAQDSSFHLQQQQQQLLHLLQNQIQLQQQQEQQQQLLMNQLSSQRQLPLKNAINEWNVVGLFSNLSPVGTAGQDSVASGATSKEKNNLGVRKLEICNVLDYPEHIMSTAVEKVKTNPGYANPEGKKTRQSRNREASVKYTKKNTVSHLLKLKRMKMRDGEDGSISSSDQDAPEADSGLNQNKEKLPFPPRGDKEMRSRPLHSYAGNRKIFSKSYSLLSKDSENDKMNIARMQVPMSDFALEVDRNGDRVKEEFLSHVPEMGDNRVCSGSPQTTDNRSAARKRKLKIPRKMIADVDYQPFDSSSDSN